MACEDAREKLLVGVWDVGMAETGDAKSRVNFKKELMKQGFCGCGNRVWPLKTSNLDQTSL